MYSKINLSILLSVLIFINLACSQEGDSTDRLSSDSFATLPMETVFEFTESDDVAFRFIRSMKIDNHGNVLVSDPSLPLVFMFDAEGNLIQQIGKKGRGPGEFLNVGSFLVTSDHLMVSDGSSLEIEIFDYRNAKYEHVRTVNVENPQLLGNLLGWTEKRILVKNDIWLSPSGQNNPTETAISFIGHEGKVLRDTLFSVPVHEFVIGDSKASFVAGKIYGNSSQLAYNSEGKIYSLWTETLSVDYFMLDGEKHHAFSYPLKPVAVTKADRDSA